MANDMVFNAMTPAEARSILESGSYINFSKDELLAAVRLLRDDATQKDVLEAFYAKYEKELEGESNYFYDYKKVADIFEGTPYAEQLEKETKETALNAAKSINENPEQPLTIGELDNIQGLFQIFPNDKKIKKAQAHVQKKAEQEMDKFIKDKVILSIHEIESAQHFVDHMDDADKKAAVQQKLDQIFKSYEEENGLNQSVEVLHRNDMTLSEHLNDVHLFKDGAVSKEFSDLKDMLSKVRMRENDEDAPLDGDDLNKNLEMVFEAAKLEIHKENVGNIKYLLSSKKDQRAQLTDKVKDLFIAKMGVAAVASSFEAPTAEEQQDEAKKEAYVQRRQKAVEETIHDWVSGKGLTVKNNQIVIACADTDIEVSKFKDILETRIGQGKSQLAQKLNSFRDGAVKLWGDRYKVARAVVKNIKENKWQYLTNTLATAAMWGASLASAEIALPAVGAYAVYSAASKAIWPVVTEAKRRQAAAEEKGEKLKFGAALKKAWEAKKQDKKYKSQVGWGVVGGIIGAAAGFGGFSMGLDTAGAKVVSSLGRMGSSMSAQTTSLIFAKNDYKKDQTDENKSNLKAARKSFWISLAASAWAADRSLGGEELADAKGLFSKLGNIFNGNGNGDAAATITNTVDGVVNPAGVDAPVVDTPTVETPSVETPAVDAPTAETPVAETPVAEPDVPQVGDVIYEKDHGNGIIETRTLGENGMAYQKVSGLSGGLTTDESVQAFYERRIHNMNQYNRLVEVFATENGQPMTANQAVESMLKQIDEGFVQLPEGMTPEHAIHTAFMQAHYKGDDSALRALLCPNGENTEAMFTKLASRYSTDMGFIGRPVDPDAKLIMRAGTVSIDKVCTPVDNSNSDVGGTLPPLPKLENLPEGRAVPDGTIVAPQHEYDEMSAKLRTVYTAERNNAGADIDTVNGRVKDLKLGKDGSMKVTVWDTDGVTAVDESGATMPVGGKNEVDVHISENADPDKVAALRERLEMSAGKAKKFDAFEESIRPAAPIVENPTPKTEDFELTEITPAAVAEPEPVVEPTPEPAAEPVVETKPEPKVDTQVETPVFMDKERANYFAEIKDRNGDIQYEIHPENFSASDKALFNEINKDCELISRMLGKENGFQLSGNIETQKAFWTAVQNGEDPYVAFYNDRLGEIAYEKGLTITPLPDGQGVEIGDEKGFVVVGKKAGYEPLRPLETAKASNLCVNQETKYASQLAMNARAKGGR